MATRLGKKLADVCKNGLLWWSRLNSKILVNSDCSQCANGSVEPQKIDVEGIYIRHAEPLKATRCQVMAIYLVLGGGTPLMKGMNKFIAEEMATKFSHTIIPKNGKLVLMLSWDCACLYIVSSGEFTIGGFQGDAGLIDYRTFIYAGDGWDSHGSGMCLSKGLTQWDRATAYIYRQMAKTATSLRCVTWPGTRRRLGFAISAVNLARTTTSTLSGGRTLRTCSRKW